MTDLNVDAEYVLVRPWCGLHDIALKSLSSHMPMCEGAVENTWIVDLSEFTCPVFNGWQENFEFQEAEYLVEPQPVIDAELEKDQNSWFTKAEVQLRGGAVFITESPDIPPDALFGINPEK